MSSESVGGHQCPNDGTQMELCTRDDGVKLARCPACGYTLRLTPYSEGPKGVEG